MMLLAMLGRNDSGDMVDMYIPRKCSMTNKLIGSTDYAAVQFNVGHVSEDGCVRATPERQICRLKFAEGVERGRGMGARAGAPCASLFGGGGQAEGDSGAARLFAWQRWWGARTWLAMGLLCGWHVGCSEGCVAHEMPASDACRCAARRLYTKEYTTFALCGSLRKKVSCRAACAACVVLYRSGRG